MFCNKIFSQPQLIEQQSSTSSSIVEGYKLGLQQMSEQGHGLMFIAMGMPRCLIVFNQRLLLLGFCSRLPIYEGYVVF